MSKLILTIGKAVQVVMPRYRCDVLRVMLFEMCNIEL